MMLLVSSGQAGNLSVLMNCLFDLPPLLPSSLLSPQQPTFLRFGVTASALSDRLAVAPV